MAGTQRSSEFKWGLCKTIDHAISNFIHKKKNVPDIIERLQALEVSLGGASGGGTQVADADVSEPEQAAEVEVVPDVSAESPVESESTGTQGPSE